MKNGMIRIGMFEAYLERMLIRGLKVAYISYFTRTLQEAKAIASTMCTTEQNTIWLNNNGPEKRYNVVGTYKAYYVPIMRGKERFYHGVILNAAIGNELFVSKEETAGEELYEILMKKYPLPLLKWWGKPILSYALKEGLINAYSNRLYTECIETEYSLQGTDDMREMQIYDLAAFDYEALKSAIQVLFQEKQIWISKKEQRSINFSSMDEYFRQYGSTLVENLENLLSPESELKGEVDAFTLNSIRLYPQQAAMVNGVTTHLLNGSTFSIICEGMGTGKTAQAAAICESYFVQKEMRRSHKALKDIYMDESLVKYRNLVMCPGHICELAERLERCQATCAPEPEITEDECAWKLGNKGYLYVQVSEGGYDYQLYHSDFSEWDGGQVDTDGTMNEAKRMILEMYEMDTQTHERILTDELENSVEEKGETSVMWKVSWPISRKCQDRMLPGRTLFKRMWFPGARHRIWQPS